MANTLLAKKAGGVDNAVATDDDHHDALANDPTITTFPQGSTMADSSTSSGFVGTTSAVTTTSTTSGFGSTSFGSTTSTTSPAVSSAGNSFGGGGFGSSSSGFGSSTNNVGSVGTSNMNVSVSNGPVLTGAGANAAQDGESLVANTNTDWVNNKWRPMMGWMYMLVCTMDFVVFTILWSLLQALFHGTVTSQWQPVTLQGAGLFHMAMGAVLGVAAYGRTKEKVAGAA